MIDWDKMMQENLVAAMVWVPSWRLMVISYEETLLEEGEVRSCTPTTCGWKFILL